MECTYWCSSKQNMQAAQTREKRTGNTEAWLVEIALLNYITVV